MAEEKDTHKAPTPLQMKKQELAATVKYGESIGEELKTSEDISDDERAEKNKELQAVLDKAEGLKADIKDLQDTDRLERKVAGIGREIFGDREVEDDTPAYKDAVAALVNSPEFKAHVADKDGRTQHEFKTGLEFKATDPTTDNPDDLRQHLRPGIIGPFVYPQRIGDLFAQETMEGSSISWLFVADGADGGADYTAYGAKKNDNATVELDEDSIKASKITTSFIVPDEALDDLPALEGTLRQILLVGPNGIGVKAEAEYIQGSGAGSPLELKGVDALNPDDVSSEADVVLNVLLAIAEIEDETGFPVTAVAVNPRDAFTVQTVTNTNDDRLQYQGFGNGPRLPDIGVPWVKSKAVPRGTIYVGAWNASIKYTRKAVSIRATNQGLGLTDYNKTLFVAETRQALVHPYGGDVYRTVSVAS